MAIEATRAKRISIIKAIEKKRGSKVITYITSDRQNLNAQIAEDIIPIVHEHIIASKLNGKSKVDLFIYSRGGDADVPWAVVSMFREYSPEGSFNVLIPYKAHSAATLISLGADEIVMSKKGELGPIDATITNIHNPIDPPTQQRIPISVEDVNGYLNLLQKIDCDKPEDKMLAFRDLSNKIGPLALGSVNRLLEQTKLVATRLLESRKKDKYNEKEIKDIVKKISSEIYSHRHAINRTEGKNYLKLKNIRLAEEESIEKEMWELYNEYNELFQFNKPFNPEAYLLENDLDEFTWRNLYIAGIESTTRFDACIRSLKVKQLFGVPPQVTLNLNNFQLPTFNIPASVQGIDQNIMIQLIQQYFQTLVTPLLSQAAIVASKELLKSLPFQGFQRIELSGGWVKI